jgi:hypothetical protein
LKSFVFLLPHISHYPKFKFIPLIPKGESIINYTKITFEIAIMFLDINARKVKSKPFE